MSDSQRWFVQGLSAHILALEAARGSTDDGDGHDADPACIRRIARSLRASAELHEHPDIARAAAAAESWQAADLPERLDRLLALLRSAAYSEHAPRVQVLIVDPDPASRRFLEASLAAPGRRFLHAGSVAEAERILAKLDVGLLLLELNLPDQDGRELLVSLRARMQYAITPIIALTANGGTRTRIECFALGADECVGKPFDAESLSACVAARLQRSGELLRWSWYDPLTELPNRSAMRRAFARAMEHATREGRDMGLALADLDRLKWVNDTYGHAAGDEVLRAFAADLAAAKRGTDVVGRWGGEEFLVLLPGAGEAGAIRVLQNALASFRERRFMSAAGETFQCTFSAGAVSVTRTERMEDAVARADHALYLAKASGRNAVQGGSREAARERLALLVEDDEVMSTVLTALLEAEGFRVRRYADAESALAAADGLTCSFAVLDIRLPRGDGLEVLRSLRKLHAFSRIPVVMVTGVRGPREIVRAFSLGADDYIAKPFSPAELQARIHRLAREA